MDKGSEKPETIIIWDRKPDFFRWFHDEKDDKNMIKKIM